MSGPIRALAIGGPAAGELRVVESGFPTWYVPRLHTLPSPYEDRDVGVTEDAYDRAPWAPYVYRDPGYADACRSHEESLARALIATGTEMLARLAARA